MNSRQCRACCQMRQNSRWRRTSVELALTQESIVSQEARELILTLTIGLAASLAVGVVMNLVRRALVGSGVNSGHHRVQSEPARTCKVQWGA